MWERTRFIDIMGMQLLHKRYLKNPSSWLPANVKF